MFAPEQGETAVWGLLSDARSLLEAVEEPEANGKRVAG